MLKSKDYISDIWGAVFGGEGKAFRLFAPFLVVLLL